MAHPSAPTYDEPPSYEHTNSYDVPPSYDSLFGEFRQVESPRGLMTFLNKMFTWLGNTVAAMVALALLNVIPLAMIIVGSINKERCPVQDSIPVWLIVTGACSLFKSAINFYLKAKNIEDPPMLVKLTSGLLNIFGLVWFILGTVWVFWAYGKYDPSPISGNAEYCDQFTMMFSFIFLVISYSVLFLTCFCFCCCCCCICFNKRPDRQHQGIPPI